MITLILSSSPLYSDSFEQGLNVALNLDELGQRCQLVLDGEMLCYCEQAPAQDEVLRKLTQIELFGLSLLAAREVEALSIRLKQHFIVRSEREISALLHESAQVVVF